MSENHEVTNRTGQATDRPRGHGTLVASVQQTIDFSGPLPPPEILKQYHEIDPGAIQWLKDRVDREQAHRHALENKVVETDKEYFDHARFYEKIGLVAAFLAVLASLGVVAYGFSLGHQWGAGILGGTTIVALAYAFLGKRKDNRDQSASNKPKKLSP